MKRLLLVGVCVLLALVAAPNRAGASERRVALVIGNGAYKSLTPLRNPVNDAEDMASALERTGFAVIKHVNVSRSELRAAIRDFRDRIALEGGPAV